MSSAKQNQIALAWIEKKKQKHARLAHNVSSFAVNFTLFETLIKTVIKICEMITYSIFYTYIDQRNFL